MQDIRRQAIIAIRWLPLILVCAIAAGAVAYAYMSSRPEVYEASGVMFVDEGPQATVQDVAAAELAAARYAFEVESEEVAEAVIAELGLDETPRDLLRQVAASSDEDTRTVGIQVRDGDPVAARAIAFQFGEQQRRNVQEALITDEVKSADRAIDKTQRDIQTLNRRLRTLRNKTPKTLENQLEIQSLIGQITSLRGEVVRLRPDSREGVRNRLEWVAQPRVPTTPVEPRPLYWTLLALVVGGMAGVAIAFVLEFLRHTTRVRDPRDLEIATGLPALGTATEKRGDISRGGLDRLVTLRYPDSDAAEAYKSLVAKIGFAEGSARTLLVAGPEDSDAKSVVAANMAIAYAEASRNVILVDADYRRPRLHRLFDVPNDRGLTSLLTDPDTPLGWVTVPSAHPRLGLMLGGPPPPPTAQALGAPLVNVLLRRLMHAADVVVFVSPSLGANLDSAVLASSVDGSVLVVPAGMPTDAATEAASTLDSARAELVGAVLYRQERGAHPRRTAVKALKPPSTRAGWWGKSSPPAQIPAVTSGSTLSAEHGERDPVVIQVDGTGTAAAEPWPSGPTPPPVRPAAAPSGGAPPSQSPRGPVAGPPPVAGRPPVGPPPSAPPAGPRPAPSNGRSPAPPPGWRGRPHDPARGGRPGSQMPGPYAIPPPEPKSSGNGAKAPHDEPTGAPR